MSKLESILCNTISNAFFSEIKEDYSTEEVNSLDCIIHGVPVSKLKCGIL